MVIRRGWEGKEGNTAESCDDAGGFTNMACEMVRCDTRWIGE